MRPDEDAQMAEHIEDIRLALLAVERLKNHDESDNIPHEQVMRNLGLTQADIDAAEDLEIE